MPRVFDNKEVAFQLIPSSQFTYKHLLEYPVWSEFYDFDEREEIIGWGIDAYWLDQELAKYHSGNEHAVYPLLEVNPFPERMSIFIRARFRTPAGQNLSGYIVNEDADPALFICHGGKEFGFNRGLLEWTIEDIRVLQRLLPDPADSIFPLVYETDFTDEEGRRIEGTFDFEAE